MPSPELSGSYVMMDTLRDPNQTAYDVIAPGGQVFAVTALRDNELYVNGTTPGLSLDGFIDVVNSVAAEVKLPSPSYIQIEADSKLAVQASWKHPIGFRFPLRLSSLGPSPHTNVTLLHVAADENVLTYQSVHAIAGRQHPSILLRFSRDHAALPAVIDAFLPALTEGSLSRDKKLGANILQAARFRTPKILEKGE